MYYVNEDDWKLFCNKLHIWQEKYIKECLLTYSLILEKDTDAANRFYELKDKINKDARHPGVMIDRKSRSNMVDIIYSLISYHVINMDDLDEFSNALIEHINRMIIK